MSEAVGVLTQVISVAAKVYDLVQTVKANKAQAKHLADRIKILTQSLSGLEQLPDTAEFLEGLRRLKECVVESKDFISGLDKKHLLVRVARAYDIKSTFKALNAKLDEAIPQLNLGLNVSFYVETRQRAKAEACKAMLMEQQANVVEQNRLLLLAAERDRSSILARQDEIIRLQKQTQAELMRARSGGAHSEVIQGRLEKIEYVLSLMHKTAAAAKPEQKSYKVPQEMQIDFCELSFSNLVAEDEYECVYQDEYDGEAVTVHCINGGKALDDSKMRLFMNAVAILYRLRSPHIVRLYAVAVENRRAAYVTESMQNGALNQYLEHLRLEGEVTVDGGFDNKFVAKFGLNIANGLKLMHKRGVLHRALNPSNIFVDEREHAKISGFELSRTVDALASVGHRSDNVRWMAPEFAIEDSYSVKSDIYSLGLIIFYMATGKVPYSGLTLPAQMSKIRAGYREKLPEHLPLQLKQVIEGCWAVEPRHRMDIKEVIAKLTTLRLELGDKLTPQTTSPRSRPAKHKRIPSMFAAGGGAGGSADVEMLMDAEAVSRSPESHSMRHKRYRQGSVADPDISNARKAEIIEKLRTIRVPIGTSTETYAAIQQSIVENDCKKLLNNLLAAGISAKLLASYAAVEVADITDIHYAIRIQDIQLLQEFLSLEVELNTLKDGQTPLHQAINVGFLAGVRMLLTAGANPNIPDSTANPALHLAIQHPTSSLDLLNALLLDGKVDCNARNAEGNTALHLAVSDAKLAETEVLVAAGAAIVVENAAGKSPLKIAVDNNLEEIIKVFRSHNLIACYYIQACKAERDKDMEKAYAMYTVAAKAGYPNALTNLATMLFFGESRGYRCKVDKARAIELWQQAAKQGHVRAQANLAKVHSIGDLDLALSPSASEALRWFQLAQLTSKAKQRGVDAAEAARYKELESKYRRKCELLRS